MNTKDISVEGIKLKVLVYGKSGTGKTTFGCSFPKPYVFDFDGGMLSQRGRDIEYDTFKDYASFCLKLDQVEKDPNIETLVLDSVTTMQEDMMANICKLNKRLTPTLHEWGLLVAGLQELFGRMTMSKKHLVIIAHEQMMQDEVTSEVWILPLVVGKKLPGQIPLWFDEVYRMSMGKNKEGSTVSQAITTADVRYSAKSRLGVLEPMEVNLTYQKIMDKLKGGK